MSCCLANVVWTRVLTRCKLWQLPMCSADHQGCYADPRPSSEGGEDRHVVCFVVWWTARTRR